MRILAILMVLGSLVPFSSAIASSVDLLGLRVQEVYSDNIVDADDTLQRIFAENGRYFFVRVAVNPTPQEVGKISQIRIQLKFLDLGIKIISMFPNTVKENQVVTNNTNIEVGISKIISLIFQKNETVEEEKTYETLSSTGLGSNHVWWTLSGDNIRAEEAYFYALVFLPPEKFIVSGGFLAWINCHYGEDEEGGCTSGSPKYNELQGSVTALQILSDKIEQLREDFDTSVSQNLIHANKLEERLNNVSLAIEKDERLEDKTSAETTRIVELENNSGERYAKFLSRIQAAQLSCNRVRTTSPVTRAPRAIATIPDGPSNALTGGGCEVPGSFGHHPPIIVSRPTDDMRSWVCQGNDPPNIPLEFSVAAYAVYCHLSDGQ